MPDGDDVRLSPTVRGSAVPPDDEQAGADATIRRVGARIRTRRKELGLTLNELAERTGVSISMLSMLERGVAGASIGTLVAVASALHLQMHDLFEVADESSQSPLIRREDQTEVVTGEGVLRRLLHHSRNDGVEVVMHEYEPGTASGDRPLHHEGREFGVLLSGSLTVEVDGVSHRLRPGDAIAYDSTRPHRIANVGRGKARAVWVNVLP
jgi:transcriptional regulator with XRE-family HTH domain